MNRIKTEGLRQKPSKDEEEYPFHMTSVLRKLFPGVEWYMDKRLKDKSGKVYPRISNPRGYYVPDFRSDELMMIIEIDGSGGRYQKHFVEVEQCERDDENIAFYKSLGYKVVAIPMYLQLDREMIKYFFDIDYKGEPLYPASSEHGFLHPRIALPAKFCKRGIDRFKKEMESIPASVREKVIDTLRQRINKNMDRGMDYKSAKRAIIPKQLDYLLQ